MIIFMLNTTPTPEEKEVIYYTLMLQLITGQHHLMTYSHTTIKANPVMYHQKI